MDLNKWIKEVSQGKSRISREEEIYLVTKYTLGSQKERQDAETRLVQYNVLPIASIALEVHHRFPNGNKVDPLDLVQVGIDTFLKKIPRFDPVRKVRLITFYTRDVKTHMQRFVMRYAKSIADGSVYLQGLASKRSNAIKALEQELNRKPTCDEIAEHMKVSSRTLESVDRYTDIRIEPILDNDYSLQKVHYPDQTPLMKMLSIMKVKLEFLTEQEFDDLVYYLSTGKPPDKTVIAKVLEHTRKGD